MRHGPNALTLLRVLLVPVFGWMLLNDVNRWLTLLVFLVAALTDFVDGWWARRDAYISDFGKIADPIADKALTGAAWVGFSLLGSIPWVATWLILLREVGITVLRLAIVNRQVVAADRGGKWKTTLQIVVISLWIVAPTYQGWLGFGLYALLWATVAVTVATGLSYLRRLRGPVSA